jgi:hypothetical protein
MTASVQTPSPTPVVPTYSVARPIKLIKHYDLLYWWAVWLYAGVAWFVTATFGQRIEIAGKALKFSTEPLLGIGFVATLLFVAVFTAIRARGPMSAILVFALLLIGVVIHWTVGWSVILVHVPDLRIHMNQAFYAVVFVTLFPIWLLTTFVFNRLRYLTFEPGPQIRERRLLGGRKANFVPKEFGAKKLDDDIFVHRFLGLWWLGFGTGDIELTYSDPVVGWHREVVENVWRADHIVDQINSLPR